MLTLNPEQHQWLLALERERLSATLEIALKRRWPTLAQRLGDRERAFIEAALQRADALGLGVHRHAARWVNLWCVWGAGFDEKPGFEWAQAIVQDGRRSAAVKVQQLFLATRDRLAEAGAAVSVTDFEAADADMVAACALPSGLSFIDQPADGPEPRVACDLSALDVGIAEQPWRHEYRLALSGDTPLMQRAALPVVSQRFRADAPTPPDSPAVVRQVAALALPRNTAAAAFLLLRCSQDDVCQPTLHPRVDIRTPQGGAVLHGAQARLLKWPLHCVDEPEDAAGPAMAAPGAALAVACGRRARGGGLVRMRPPSHVAVSVNTCHLRRAGAPLGPQELMLTVWPAHQWLYELRAFPQPEWQWPQHGERPIASSPHVRLLRDDEPQPVQDWLLGWQALPQGLLAGMDRWWHALQRHPALLRPHVALTPGLMHGHTAWTWGAKEQVTPEGSLGFWRAQAVGGLMACNGQLSLAADLVHGEAVARLQLRARGEAKLNTTLCHEQAEPPLAGELARMKVGWHFPFEAEMLALSQPGLATLSLDARRSRLGGLSGEAGLRPRPDGQGFEWHCQVRLEAAELAFRCWDPRLGLRAHTVALWPETPLLDWSTG